MKSMNIIPQFYYDVIARAIPGGVLIVVTSLAIQRDLVEMAIRIISNDSMSEYFFSLYFMILFSLSYVVGHTISSLGYLFQLTIIEKVWNKKFHILRESCTSEACKYTKKVKDFLINEAGVDPSSKTEEYTLMLFIWADWLRQTNPDVGARLVKLRAEYLMHAGNCIAFIFGVLIHILWGWTEDISVLLVLVFSLFAFISGLSNAGMYSTFQQSVISNYYAAKEIEKSNVAGEGIHA